MSQPRKFRPAWVPDKPKRTPYEDSEARKESAAFYGSRQWKELRDQIRQREPLCRHCLADGIIRLGYAIDHIIPRKQDPSKALDPDNLRNLCKTCHNKVRKEQK